MLERKDIQSEIGAALKRSRITGLIGPRQCGKTTLARTFVDVDSSNYFDLEDPLSLERLSEPKLALESLKGLVVIDEIQRKPDLWLITNRNTTHNRSKFFCVLNFSG